MSVPCRIAVILTAALIVAGGAAIAQVDTKPPPGAARAQERPTPGDFLPRLPGEPPVETPNLDAFPVPPVPGGTPPDSATDEPDTSPGTATAPALHGSSSPTTEDNTAKPDNDSASRARLALRAQYDAGMQTVDSGIAVLAPFVSRTVIGLKRVALGRISDDPVIAARQQRQVVAGLRGLAIAEQRLRGFDGILDRWRMAQPTSPQEQAAMLAGVFRRAGDAGIIRHQIACGRYFGTATVRAIRSGATRGVVRIPPGC